MRKRKVVQGLATVALSGAMVAVGATPAHATTSSGERLDFWYSCDAYVYISDDLIGSAGKIEAWAGFSCSQQYWGGTLRIELRKNGRKASEATKSVGSAMTDSVETTVTNSGGIQDWQAFFYLSRPGMSPTTVVIDTGVISS